ncbi:MAG TPA: hypothetical protein VN717_04625 [Gemmatimonadaceae bacterium]|nr:hypothetical protein [Gemmatimonadaceae bacterium]
MVNAQVASRTAVLLGTFLCFAQIGCTSSSAATPEDKDLESLKHAVAGFHDLSTAQQGGYTAVVGDPTDGHTCLSDPQEGGMGVHFLDKALVDDTVIVTRPEIVIYEPQQDGSMKFVGVEYIIPFGIRGADQTPPKLFGHEFSKNATFQLWGLHAWVGQSNPVGTFAMYNPDVSCKYSR